MSTTLDTRSTPERTLVDLRNFDLAGARVLGRYHYTRPHRPLPPHRHRGMLEICYLHRGRQSYEVEGVRYELRGGDFFLTRPGEWHSTDSNPEERGVLYWLILTVSPPPRHFLGQADPLGRALLERIRAVKKRHFRGARRAHAALEAIMARAGSPRHPLTCAIIRSHALQFLLTFLQAAEREERATHPVWLPDVLARIRSCGDTPLQVSDLADAAGLSLSHFKNCFREVMGVSPGEYMLRQRVEAAARAIRTSSATITEVAFAHGFSSSQNFATAFKRLTGTSPGMLRGSR